MTAQQDHTASAAPPEQEQAKNPLLRHADFYFPRAQIEQKIDSTLMQQRGKIAMPGFRRGKVPLSMLRQRYGRETLHEILQKECATKFQEQLDEQKERAAAHPHLRLPDMPGEAGQYHVHCHYEVIPPVAAPDFSEKKLQKPTFNLDEAAIDEMVEILRTQRGEYSAIDEAVKDNGCRLRTDFTSILLNEDGSQSDEVVESGKDRLLPLDDKNLRPELRDALIGARADQTREVVLEVSENTQNDKLRGRKINMQVTVRAVEQLNKAQLNEQFFAAFGDEAKTLESFRQMVREHLARESKVRLRNFLHTRAMDLLLSATPTFPLPESLLYQECQRMLQQAQAQWKQRGLAETTAQLSLQMFLPQAKKRVGLGLILSAWQQRESPSIDKDDLEARLQEIAAAYEDPAAAAAQIRGNQTEMEAIYLSLLEDRVTDWVCEHCEGEEAPMALADFLNTAA